MSRRQLPGALILGLLASLLAHAAGFGGAHVQGGAYHAVLQTLALLGAGMGLLGALWAAFASPGRTSQGSVLAARLERWIPRSAAVIVSGLAWFALIESLEPSHAGASALVIAFALVTAAFALRHGARAVARLFANAVLRIAAHPAQRRIAFVPRAYVAPAIAAPHVARQVVTRPPPRLVSF